MAARGADVIGTWCIIPWSGKVRAFKTREDAEAWWPETHYAEAKFLMDVWLRGEFTDPVTKQWHWQGAFHHGEITRIANPETAEEYATRRTAQKSTRSTRKKKGDATLEAVNNE